MTAPKPPTPPADTLEQGFDKLVKNTGRRSFNFDVHHCGNICHESEFLNEKGLWSYEVTQKSRKYQGWAVQSCKSDLTKTPYYLKLRTIGASFSYADFEGESFKPLLEGFGLKHEDGAILFTKWAKSRGFDLVFGTNGDQDEVVVVDPIAKLKITDCENLHTQTWIMGGPNGVVRAPFLAPIAPLPSAQLPNHAPAPAKIEAPKKRGLRAFVEAAINTLKSTRGHSKSKPDDTPSP